MKRPGVPQDFRARYENETADITTPFQSKEVTP
jgi:hypothetical protein